jgi:hypothetical protein
LIPASQTVISDGTMNPAEMTVDESMVLHAEDNFSADFEHPAAFAHKQVPSDIRIRFVSVYVFPYYS